MKKVKFCKDNGFKTKTVYKNLKSEYPDVKIKRKDCLGECKTCKSSPFSVVDGKVIACRSTEDLYDKIKKRA